MRMTVSFPDKFNDEFVKLRESELLGVCRIFLLAGQEETFLQALKV